MKKKINNVYLVREFSLIGCIYDKGCFKTPENARKLIDSIVSQHKSYAKIRVNDEDPETFSVTVSRDLFYRTYYVTKMELQ